MKVPLSFGSVREKNAWLIKSKALELGFDQCGISKAGFLEKEAPRLEKWLSEGRHGTMSWMERNFDKRLDPTKLVEGARSVISVTLNYFPEAQQETDGPKISKYAYGADYHSVLKDKLFALVAFIKEEIGDISGRAFVDSAPIMDKAWAAKSGLGWIGKNSNLITRGQGSFFFLGELVIDLELEPDSPVADHCGTCTACIDACPTDAITPYQVDGSKCISYFTIELKESIPTGMEEAFNDWVFGCDICQDVCPWNRFSKPNSEPAFGPDPRILNMKETDWHEITSDVFKEVFKNSAVKRTKYEGFRRNLDYIKRKPNRKHP